MNSFDYQERDKDPKFGYFGHKSLAKIFLNFMQ